MTQGAQSWNPSTSLIPGKVRCALYYLSVELLILQPGLRRTQDRSNISNARVAGLQTDLKMTNKQYSIALTVTYVPYIAAELPSNLLLKIVGPNLMLPTMLTLWGVVTTLQGIVKRGTRCIPTYTHDNRDCQNLSRSPCVSLFPWFI
jgi:hypothetical protein